jgi:putative nucleotidyltransferase with HDIG domain
MQALGAMPPLSAVAIQMQRFAQDDVDMRTVANAISADPGLSADVLRLANSALFGARHTVPGVLHAIVMLGLDRVRTLVFTAAFMRFANPHRSEGAMKRCWRHSIACALIADELSNRARLDRDAAYTAGILHDIGRLAMLRLWPAPYAALLDAAVPGDPEILAHERQELAVDHTEAGDYLLRRWQLPETLIGAAKHHHDPEAPPMREASGVIHCACALADAVGFVAAGAPAESPLVLSAELQGMFTGSLEDLQFRVATRMNALEVWL